MFGMFKNLMKHPLKSLERDALGPIFGPGSPINSKITGPMGNSNQADAAALAANNRTLEQGALNDLQTALPNIPKTLSAQYTSDAQNAGTYGNTPAFQSALQSEVQAGTRGARTDNLARQNALRAQLGMDPLPPEQSGDTTTDSNATKNALTTNAAATQATNSASISGGAAPAAAAPAAMPQSNATAMAMPQLASDQSQNAVTQRQNALAKKVKPTSPVV